MDYGKVRWTTEKNVKPDKNQKTSQSKEYV